MLQTTYPTIIQYLQKFGELSPQEVLMIEAELEAVHLQRGQWLVEEGQSSEYLYFLTRGLVRTVVDSDDTDVTIWVTLPDHFLSSAYSYIKKKPSVVGLQAITKAELLRIERSEVKRLYEQIPVLKDISLAIMNEYYIDLERLYIFCLSHSARKRYASLNAYFPDHFLKVPLKYLASMIHIKPETLSRIRRIQEGGRDLGLRTG